MASTHTHPVSRRVTTWFPVQPRRVVGRRRGVDGALSGKKPALVATNPTMEQRCGEIRKSISVSLDEEKARVALAETDLHLADCDACRRWREAAHQMTRRFRLQGVHAGGRAPAAVRSAVLAAVPRPWPGLTMAVRVALGVVGIVQVVLTGRLLLSGAIGRFGGLGALGVAVGAGFVVAAIQPHRAVGMRPTAAAAVVLLAGSALLDLARHPTTASDGATLAVMAGGFVLVMVLAWRAPVLGVPTSALSRWTACLRGWWI